MRLVDLDAKEPYLLDGRYAVGILDNAPTVERPQGEWKHEVVGDKLCVLCNQCFLHFDCESNFCPNCGAKMRGYADCMDEDAKQASIPYTYNSPQHDWKCGYPGNEDKVFDVSYLHQDSITKSDTQV